MDLTQRQMEVSCQLETHALNILSSYSAKICGIRDSLQMRNFNARCRPKMKLRCFYNSRSMNKSNATLRLARLKHSIRETRIYCTGIEVQSFSKTIGSHSKTWTSKSKSHSHTCPSISSQTIGRVGAHSASSRAPKKTSTSQFRSVKSNLTIGKIRSRRKL